MSTRSLLGLLSFIALGSLVMCDRQQASPSAGTSGPSVHTSGTGVTNMQPMPPPGIGSGTTTVLRPDVVDQLAQSWCERARTCNQIGTGLQYPAFFDCTSQRRGAIRSDLSALTCTHSIDWSKASACAGEVEEVSCQEQLVTLLSLEKCRSDTLCAR